MAFGVEPRDLRFYRLTLAPSRRHAPFPAAVGAFEYNGAGNVSEVDNGLAPPSPRAEVRRFLLLRPRIRDNLLTCTPRMLPGFSPFKASRFATVARLCMGDGRHSEPDRHAGTPARSKRGTAWPAASSAATQVPDEFPSR